MRKQLLTATALFFATVSIASAANTTYVEQDDETQFDKPYYAYGGIALKGATITDMLTGKQTGDLSYIYDSEGNLINTITHYEYVDSETGLSMKEIDERSDSKATSVVYYLDNNTHKWEIYSANYWEKNEYDITLKNIYQFRNEQGELITQTLIDSELDDHGRVVKTNSYDDNGDKNGENRIDYSEDGFMNVTLYYYNSFSQSLEESDKYSVKTDPVTGETTRISYKKTYTNAMSSGGFLDMGGSSATFVYDNKTVTFDNVKNNIGISCQDYYKWNMDTQDWVLSVRDSSVFNVNNHYHITLNYYDGSEFCNGSKEEWITDPLTGGETYAVYDYENNEWVGISRTETISNNTDVAYESTKMTFKWSDGGWVNFKKEYSYNTTDNLNSNSTEYRWNSESKDWYIYHSEIEEFINVNDQKKLVLRDYISTRTTSRQVYTYDSNGNQTSETVYSQNEKSEWVPQEKETKTYNENSQVLSCKQYYPNDKEGDTPWVCIREEEYRYDSNGTCIYDSYLSEWDSYSSKWYSGERNRTTVEYDGTIITKFYEIWDSESDSWIMDTKTVTTHNDREHTICKYWHAGGDWEIQSKTEYLYSGTELIGINEYESYYDDYQGEYMFDIVRKTEISQDADSTITVNSIYSTDNKTWTYKSKTVDYTTPDNETVSESYKWSGESWSLKSSTKTLVVTEGIYTTTIVENYDSNGSLARTQTTVKDINGVELENKYIQYTVYGSTGSWYQVAYTEDGKLAMEASYRWDSFQNAFVGQQKKEYEYDEFGNLCTTASYYIYIPVSNTWIGSDKNGVIYDENGNDIGSTYYYWDHTNNVWIGSNRFSRISNKQGNITTNIIVRWRWDSTSNSWVYESRITDITSVGDFGNIEYVIAKDEFYNAEKSEWTIGYIEKTEYIYDQITGIAPVNVPDALIRVADDMLIVDAPKSSTMTVRTLGGTTVATGKGTLNVNLPAGIYLVTVDSVTTKIIVR